MSTKAVHKNTTFTNKTIQTPRWKNRLLKSVQRAALATTLTLSALSLASCAGKVKVEPITPRPLHNIYFDPELGTFFVRPDGADAFVANPLLYGKPMHPGFIPIIAVGVGYKAEYSPLKSK